MPANQQLKDYIAQQTKLGISKDTIKGALIGAGWGENDVAQAMAEADSLAQDIIPPISPVQPARPAEAAAAPVQNFSAPKVSPLSSIGSDAFKPKGEPVFEPAAMTEKNYPEKVKMDRPQQAAVIDVKEPAKKSGGGLGIAVFGILSVVLLGGNVYFYFQNKGLSSQIALSVSAPGGNNGTQNSSDSAEVSNLKQQVDSLNKNISDLTNQVSIFSAPENGTATSTSFSVSGTLGGGGKLLYSITTNKGVMLSIKNSKDAKVDAALKPFLGGNIDISGTHQPESTYLTVTSVNGQPLEGNAQQASSTVTAPVPQSTTTAATSTVKSSTTTQSAPSAFAPASSTPPANSTSGTTVASSTPPQTPPPAYSSSTSSTTAASSTP